MNGRVYDPQLARFLSPDPLVQAPTNSQSWNRYSYVFNNPLKYTDPSGYSAESDGCITETSEQKVKVTCTALDDDSEAEEEVIVIGYADGSSGSRDSGAIQVDKSILDQTRGHLSDSAPYGPNNTNFTAVPWMVAPANLAPDDPRLTVMGVAPVGLGAKVGVSLATMKTATFANLPARLGSQALSRTAQAIVRGKLPLGALTKEQRAIAAKFYRESASRKDVSMTKGTSAFNRARADYLDGKIDAPPGGAKEWMDRNGY